MNKSASVRSVVSVVQNLVVEAPSLLGTWDVAAVHVVPLGGEPLDLGQTLACGQAFRWWPVAGAEGVWEGVAAGRVWRLWVGDDALWVQVIPDPGPSATADWVRRYFWLDRPARAIQAAVAAAHPLAARAVAQFAGLRVLRQEPVEAFLSFAIASATNVPRITRSIAALTRNYGRVSAVIDGQEFHAFPTPAALVAAPTADLFGPCNLAYRARHLQSFAQALIVAGGAGWLERLAAGRYAEAHAALDALPFCGPKVADCICLFGLGFAEAVPVDVHVWAIAHELFGAAIPTRTLTPRTYAQVGARFRDLFGADAGWAQQYLYCARRATPIRERHR